MFGWPDDAIRDWLFGVKLPRKYLLTELPMPLREDCLNVKSNEEPLVYNRRTQRERCKRAYPSRGQDRRYAAGTGLLMKTPPQPWRMTMEATIFTGWIYDHLLPGAAEVKVEVKVAHR